MDEISNLYADFKADIGDLHLGHGFVSKYFSSNSWNCSSTTFLHKSFISLAFGFCPFNFSSYLFFAKEFFFSRLVDFIPRFKWLQIFHMLTLFLLLIMMFRIYWFLVITLILGWFMYWFFLVYLLLLLFQYGS